MRVIGLAVVCIVNVLRTPLTGESQGRSEIRRVGYVQANFGGFPSGFYEVLRDGLQDLGYQEGRNLALVYRASDDRSQVADLIAELLQLKSEVIVAPGGAASIAQEATKTVPIGHYLACLRFSRQTFGASERGRASAVPRGRSG